MDAYAHIYRDCDSRVIFSQAYTDLPAARSVIPQWKSHPFLAYSGGKPESSFFIGIPHRRYGKGGYLGGHRDRKSVV